MDITGRREKWLNRNKLEFDMKYNGWYKSAEINNLGIL